MEKTTIELTDPIQFGSETIKSIEFSGKVKAKHLEEMPIGEMKYKDIMAVAQKLSNQPPAVFKELSFEDLGKVSKFVGEALGVGEKIGSS